MKKVLIPIVGTLGAGVIVISGISNFANAEKAASSLEHRPSSFAKIEDAKQASLQNPAAQENSLGLINFNITIQHLPRLESSQIRLWIEDEHGNVVKTLFSVSASAKENINPESLEGSRILYWNCRDESFWPVKPGTYTYSLEGSLNKERRVLYKGKFLIGDKTDHSSASPADTSKSADDDGIRIGELTADFSPFETLDAVGITISKSRGS